MRIPVLKSRSTRPHRGSLNAAAIAKLRRARRHGSPLRPPSPASRYSRDRVHPGRPDTVIAESGCDAGHPPRAKGLIAYAFTGDSPVVDGGRCVRGVLVIRFAPARPLLRGSMPKSLTPAQIEQYREEGGVFPDPHHVRDGGRGAAAAARRVRAADGQSARLFNRWGRLDILVGNAAEFRLFSPHIDPTTWDDVVDFNLTSTDG